MQLKPVNHRGGALRNLLRGVTMSPITRTLAVFVFTLILISSISPALAFDDKSKVDQSTMFEKVGEKERIYNLSFDDTWKLCNNAALRTFEKVSADKDTLKMNSGISLSPNAYHIVVNVEKIDPNHTRVKVSTQKKKFLAWGSGN